MALIERVRTDTMEAESLQKERDDLLRAVEGLCTKCDLAHQERTDAQQRIDLLEGELEVERDLKVVVEGVFTRLTTEVGWCQEEVQRLETEVTRQHDEVRNLRADMDGEPSVSLVVFLPRIRGRPFDMFGMWLGQVLVTSLAWR